MKDSELHILVAEDNSDEAFILVRALQKDFPRISIHVAKDGAEAIEYLAGRGVFHDREKFPWPNALITDLKMPRVSGFELLDWLRQYPEFRVTPTLMFSSSVDELDIARSHELGATAYMTKSVCPNELGKIATLLRNYWTQNPGSQKAEVDTNAANKPRSEITAHAQPTATGFQIEIGETEKHSFAFDVIFPSGIAFRTNDHNVAPRFQFHKDSRLDIYEADIGAQERLTVRIERERCAHRHSKVRVLANGRLLQVSDIRGRATARDTVFQVLLPGAFLVLIAFYSFTYKPEVADFYCKKLLSSHEAQPQYRSVPNIPRVAPLG